MRTRRLLPVWRFSAPNPTLRPTTARAVGEREPLGTDGRGRGVPCLFPRWGVVGLGTPGCVLGAFVPIPDPGWASRAHADRARGRSASEGRRHGRLGGRVVRVCPCRLDALALDVALSCFCACPASPARVARRVAWRGDGRRHARGGSARESAGGHQLWLLLPAGTRPRPSAAASWVVRERGWPLSRARGRDWPERDRHQLRTRPPAWAGRVPGFNQLDPLSSS